MCFIQMEKIAAIENIQQQNICVTLRTCLLNWLLAIPMYFHCYDSFFLCSQWRRNESSTKAAA